MALASGFPVVHRLKIFGSLRGPRTSLGYAGETFKVPGIVAEVEGLGFGEMQERTWVDQNVQGTTSVMRHLGMLDGHPVRCPRYLVIQNYWRVGPSVGGYLEPLVGLARQFTEVASDEVLAKVIKPTTFELLEEIRSPGRGVIFYACRGQMVRPGSWSFGVANIEDGLAHWEDGEP